MVKLTDVCDFQGGSQPPKEEWSSEARDGYIRMLQIRDFTQSDRVTPEYIKISGSTKTCKADDVLIARYGASLGKILTGLSGAYNVAIMRTIPDETVLMKKYLYYYLNSPYFQTGILNVGSRAAQAGFNKDDLSKLDIPCPPFEEQDKIVRILQKVDDVIEKREAELEHFDKLIKARFVEMFEQGNYPQVAFGDVCEFIRNGASIKQTKGAGGYPITRIETLSNDVFNTDRLGYADIFELGKYENYLLKRGDILISHINSVAYLGRAVQYRGETDSPIIHGMNLLCARIVEGYNPTYIEFFFKTPMAKDYILTITKKAVNQASITTSDLKKMMVPAPSIEEQNEFDRFVLQVDKSKSVAQKSLDKALILYGSLMQQYFG